MSGSPQRRDDPVPTKEVRAEAADWIARLHDEQRAPDVDAQFQAWLGESEEHKRAFSHLTHVWERAGGIRMRARHNASDTRKSRSRFTPWAATLAAAAVLAVIATIFYRHDNALVTGVGQRQVRLLPDGTRVVLNTDTRIEVNYDEHARRIRLTHGEAWFDVSKHPAWPFLVRVGDREIRALGTSFIVRHDDIQDLSVTLVEGRISITPITQNENDVAPSPAAQVLVPGQRLMISRRQPPAVDRPELSRVTAWERGRVEFEDTALEDAANEMNRYSTTQVTVADARVAQLRVGGVFRAGDSDEFVKVVTAAFGLRADRNDGGIVLFRPATGSPPSTVQ